jgi:hypothetical protein
MLVVLSFITRYPDFLRGFSPSFQKHVEKIPLFDLDHILGNSSIFFRLAAIVLSTVYNPR